MSYLFPRPWRRLLLCPFSLWISDRFSYRFLEESDFSVFIRCTVRGYELFIVQDSRRWCTSCSLPPPPDHFSLYDCILIPDGKISQCPTRSLVGLEPLKLFELAHQLISKTDCGVVTCNCFFGNPLCYGPRSISHFRRLEIVRMSNMSLLLRKQLKRISTSSWWATHSNLKKILTGIKKKVGCKPSDGK